MSADSDLIAPTRGELRPYEGIWCTGGDDLTTTLACLGTEVDDMIGGQYCITVVFNDKNAVPDITEFLECRNEAFLVARVQADARLIENIGYTGETTTELACELDSTHFTTGKRRCPTV